jgi:predicted nuclease of predicted toxin-antitoxin system
VKFKLDENLGSRTAGLIGELGHDVQTVSQEKLNGIDDARLFEICATEGRCLITLDLDFADILRFPPHTGAGIAVLRLPQTVSLKVLAELVGSLLAAIERENITGRLWVIQAGRIRVHDPSGGTAE